jgi:dTDP-4-amino-4,6-dideoxygalactose transaminase
VYEIDDRELKAVRKVLKARQLFRYHRGHHARFTSDLEQHLCETMGVKYALATSSGTASLICSLVGLGIGPGDEVIVPGYTFISTALAPLAVGAVPIIAEVDQTLTLDPADVEARITRHTKAIVPVYMLGLPCHVDKLRKIARKHRIALVEDAAQAAGGTWKGKRFGSIGDVGILSFNYFKIITAGEGGAVLTSNRQVYNRAMVYHDGGCVFFNPDAAGETPDFFAGVNYRTNEISAAIMDVQLGRLDGILKKLRSRKHAMCDILARSDAFELSPNPEPEGDCASNLPLLFETADAARTFREKHLDAVPMFRPIETDRHVYSNWEPILKKKVHHPGMNPWKWAKRKIRYSKKQCPQTLEILARTVVINTPFDKTLAEARKIARRLVKG